MHNVLTRGSPESEVARLAGGKGRNLYALGAHSSRVPDWAVLPATILREHAERTSLMEEVRELVRGVAGHSLQRVAAAVQSAFLSREIEGTTLRAIEKAYKTVGAERVAVRSSGADEDAEDRSFAGQYASFLNVRGIGAVAAGVRRTWASAYSARSLAYRLAHRLPVDWIDMAVIVQRMVYAEKSGVVFTANPMTRRRDEMVISAVYGLGEGLVSGSVDADTVVVDKLFGAAREVVVGEKAEVFLPAVEEAGVARLPVPDEDRRRLCLRDDELAMVRFEAERLEAAFGRPLDIEWAIADGTLFILQSRPITALTPPRRGAGERRVWDNSNIIESYSGITAPMTFSFARHVYHQVYRSYARLLGVPPARLERMDEWLACMLAYHHGRVYYNLLNWYKIVRLVPFYRLNRRMLDLTIGAEEPLDDELAESLRPWETDSRRVERATRFLSAVLFFWHFLTIDRSVDRFLRFFEAVHAEFDREDYRTLAAEETWRRLRSFRGRMLRPWGRMILLEQTIGLAIGILQELTRRWIPDAPESFLYEMTKPSESLASVEPAERLKELARHVQRDERLRELLGSAPPEELYARLAERPEPFAADFRRRIDDYVRRFGYRSINELKLEEPDLREDPSILFSMLSSVLGQLDVERPGAQGEDAESRLLRSLSGWRLTAYRLARAKVRRSLAAREKVRFCRTRAFGTVRRMINGIGADLAERGLIASPRDVFLLRMEELGGWLEGTGSQRELLALIALRREQQRDDARLEAPGRFETRGVPSSEELRLRGWRAAGAPQTAASAEGEVLRGTPCSPGVAEGDVQLVSEPRDVGGKILVTYRTDPGWAPVLASASALLIERGSPLTHVAIVAREMGIPTVIQIKDLTRRLATGMKVSVDGGAGTARVLQGGGPRDEVRRGAG